MASETGTRIRLARERRQWSQQQLADECGVDVKTVRNWEKTGKIRNRQGLIESVLGIRLDDGKPGAAPPSLTVDDALDRLEREIAELRRLREGRGKEQQDDEPNGDSRRAG